MQVLITGGAGFIGSHLAEALLARGDEVYVIDDLSTGSLTNITHLLDQEYFHFCKAAVEDEPALTELVERADLIFHLAAAVGVRLVAESPVRTIQTNLHGTETLLMLADAHKTPVFIASTSEVYGKSTRIPFREDDDLLIGPPTSGRWSYACSKAMSEFLALAYHQERGLPVIIGRFFNTIGARQTGRYGMVLPRFINQALSNQPITVFGDGNQSRCFVEVSDVVRAIIELMHDATAVGQVFNIGSDHEITIKQLASLVKEITGSPSEIIHVPYERVYGGGFEDMARRVPDLSKLRQVIAFQPSLSIEHSIQAVVNYVNQSKSILE
jgi:UDP-glucose 4-epimerase